MDTCDAVLIHHKCTKDAGHGGPHLCVDKAGGCNKEWGDVAEACDGTCGPHACELAAGHAGPHLAAAAGAEIVG